MNHVNSQSICWSDHPSVRQSVQLPVRLSACLSVCQSVIAENQTQSLCITTVCQSVRSFVCAEVSDMVKHQTDNFTWNIDIGMQLAMSVVHKTLVHAIVFTCQVFYCQVSTSNVMSVRPCKGFCIEEPHVCCAWYSERDTWYGDCGVRSSCSVLWFQHPLRFSCRKQITLSVITQSAFQYYW